MQQLIKLEILATGAHVDVYSLVFIGFMRIGGYFFSNSAFK